MMTFFFFFGKQSKSLDTTLSWEPPSTHRETHPLPKHELVLYFSLRLGDLHIIAGGEKGKGSIGSEYVWPIELQPQIREHCGNFGFLISVNLNARWEGRSKTNTNRTSCLELWGKQLTGKGYKSGEADAHPVARRSDIFHRERARVKEAGKHWNPFKSLAVNTRLNKFFWVFAMVRRLFSGPRRHSSCSWHTINLFIYI